MPPTTLRTTVAAFAFIGALALATPSMAAMVNFKANLSGKNQVPATASAGTGSVTAT
jgi:hypothetical protein